jgi:peptidoglycan L-alanyl-D-glutamate endopeptidase CwlK
MIDTPTINRIKNLHPIIKDEVESAIKYINEKVLTGRAKVRITQGLRTFKEQDDLFALGRTKPGKIVTKAKGGFSYHNYGLAFDICLIIDSKEVSWDIKKDFDKDLKADWMEVVETFRYRNFTWGGSFGDNPHFEKGFGHSVRDLLKLYNNSEFIKGTKYLKI